MFQVDGTVQIKITVEDVDTNVTSGTSAYQLVDTFYTVAQVGTPSFNTTLASVQNTVNLTGSRSLHATRSVE